MWAVIDGLWLCLDFVYIITDPVGPKHIKKSKENPAAYVSIITDNMDHAKMRLPRFAIHSKVLLYRYWSTTSSGRTVFVWCRDVLVPERGETTWTWACTMLYLPVSENRRFEMNLSGFLLTTSVYQVAGLPKR